MFCNNCYGYEGQLNNNFCLFCKMFNTFYQLHLQIITKFNITFINDLYKHFSYMVSWVSKQGWFWPYFKQVNVNLYNYLHFFPISFNQNDLHRRVVLISVAKSELSGQSVEHFRKKGYTIWERKRQ